MNRNEYRCLECGGLMRRAKWHVRVDPRGVVFPRPVVGVTCDDCGRTFAAPEVWRSRMALGASPLLRAVSTSVAA